MSQYNAGMDEVVAPGLGGEGGPAKWPKVVGVLSIVFGSLGVLVNGLCSCFMLAGPPFFRSMIEKIPKDQAPPRAGQNPKAAAETLALMQPWMAAQGLLMVVTLFTSVWLLIAGIMMLGRKPASVGQHKAWAWVRIVLAVLSAVLGVVSTAVTAARQAEIDQAYGGSKTAAGVLAQGLGFGVGGFVLIVVYPIVVLVVLSKPWAKAEVARWGEPLV